MSSNILEFEFTSGFFSTCTVLMRNIVGYHLQNNILPKIETSKLWNTYKDAEIDIYTKFFERKNDIINLEPSKFSPSLDEDQFSDFNLINYDYVNFIVNQYFSPSIEIIKIKNELIQKYNIDLKNTISVCYRGNDKSRETNLPTYDEMLNKITQIKYQTPNKKLLIQTDELEFSEYMLSHFPDSIVIHETKKIKRSNTAIQYTIPFGEKVITAQNFLSVMYLMSETSSIILNSGSVGMWVCLFRGNSNDVYQYLNPLNSDNPIKWVK
jgi:hypothetical protein